MSEEISNHGIQCPLPVRLLNRTGSFLQRLGMVFPRLDAQQLVEEAQRRTGLHDFGGEGFRPGLKALVDSLTHDADLTLIGRISSRQQILELLVQRLRLIDYRKQHSELAKQKITAPLFVVGLPRTGTTILYNLLAQDPEALAPLAYQVADPLPPAARSSSEEDPRIQKCERQLQQLERLIPGFNAIHPVGARLPQECISIMAYEFVSVLFALTARSYTTISAVR